jgi:hypothetical protein
MYSGAPALLASLLIASSAASSSPPHPAWLLQNPMQYLQAAQAILLVRVLESKPGATPEHTTATLQVIKSWKGPYCAGRILHAKAPVIVSCAGECTPYVFQPVDKELLIQPGGATTGSGATEEPIAVWKERTWPAVESKDLMDALDWAVVQCPSCAKPPTPSR